MIGPAGGFATGRQAVNGPLLVRQSQPGHSFFGDAILSELVTTQFQRTDPEMTWKVEDGVFSDDPVIGDPTLGIPTLMVTRPARHYWHNSAQTMEIVDHRLLENNTVVGAAYCLALSALDQEQARRIAEQIAAEGSETLSHEAECLGSQLADPDHGQVTVEAVRRVHGRLEYLHRRHTDRLDTLERWPLLADQQVQTAIASAQQQLHEAHREAQEATASWIPQMAATLSNMSERRELSHARRLAANMTCTRTRPGFPMDLARAPQEVRTRHDTLELAPLAYMDGERNLLQMSEECIRDHHETDSPASRCSPLGKLVDLGGKILMLGAPLGSLTFIHLIEDCLNLPFLKRAYGWIEREDGRLETVAIPRWLPGHRDWYHPPAEERKLFRALRAAGWQTQRLDVGMGRLELINAQQLFQIAMEVVSDDPTLVLCDDPHCLFCAKYQKILREEWQPPDEPVAVKAAPDQL